MADPFNLRSEPLHEKAYQLLRGLILGGKLHPGEPFGETSLAADLGVSRTPVRDALRRLQQDRLIVSLPGGQFEVYQPTRRDLEEIYACREYLEGLAARSAALQRTEAHVAGLQAVLHRMQQAYLAGDDTAIRSLDTQFHEVIVTASGNSVLREIVGGLQARWSQARNALPNPGINRDRVLSEHTEILAAIADQNEGRAEERMRAHILFSRAAVIRQLFG